MAKIVEEVILIRVSKIVKDEDVDVANALMDEEFIVGIEAMADQLLDDPKVLIEVVKQ